MRSRRWSWRALERTVSSLYQRADEESRPEPSFRIRRALWKELRSGWRRARSNDGWWLFPHTTVCADRLRRQPRFSAGILAVRSSRSRREGEVHRDCAQTWHRQGAVKPSCLMYRRVERPQPFGRPTRGHNELLGELDPLRAARACQVVLFEFEHFLSGQTIHQVLVGGIVGIARAGALVHKESLTPCSFAGKGQEYRIWAGRFRHFWYSHRSHGTAAGSQPRLDTRYHYLCGTLLPKRPAALAT